MVERSASIVIEKQTLSVIVPESIRDTPAPGWERYYRRSIHPTAGSQYTVVLGPPVEPPIYVRKRRHFDRPLKHSRVS